MDKNMFERAFNWVQHHVFLFTLVSLGSLLVIVLAVLMATNPETEQLDASSTVAPVITAGPVSENEVIPVASKPSAVVTSFINDLTTGNIETIKKAFGVSDVYTPEAVSDRIKVARVSYMSGSLGGQVYSNLSDMPAGESGAAIGIHICTLDYEASYNAAKAKEAELTAANPNIAAVELKDQVERDIAKRTQNGEFDAHYNIDLTVEYENNPAGEVQITEDFKQAITGGWYRTGDKLDSVDCPLGNEATKAKADNSVIEDYRVPDATATGNPEYNGTTAPMPKAEG